MKTISVIIATYNSAKTIQKTLDSINCQKGKDIAFNIEIIVVDDCSTDETPDILEQNKIKFYSTPSNSGGPNKARNIGLDLATGDYICITDHDDIWMPTKVLEQLKVCYLAPIISTGYITFNETNGDQKEYISHSDDGSGVIIYEENETFKTLLTRSKKGQITYIGGLMFESSLKDIRFEEIYSQVDFDWGLRLFRNNLSLEICKPLYIRNITGENLSLNESYRMNDYRLSIQTAEALKNEYPYEARTLIRMVNGTMGRYYYSKGDMNNARKYLIMSGLSIKSLGYYLTSYFGYQFVNRNFRVFGFKSK